MTKKGSKYEVVYHSDGSYSVKMSGTEDADLYTRYNSIPDINNYACRPYLSTSNEECATTSIPAGAEELFIMVNGYKASTFTLTVSVGD